MSKRFPLVRQEDDNDCGAAALASICLFHRRPVGLQHLRTLAGTDKAGTNLRGLVEAAERSGFAARAVKGRIDSLSKIPLPAIAHVMASNAVGHFVVVTRVKAGSVEIGDPAHGMREMGAEDFQAIWSGYLVLLVTRAQSIGHGVEASTSSGRRLLGLVNGHRTVVAETVACALLMTLLGVASSLYVQHLIDSVLVRHETPLLHALGIGMVLIALVRATFNVLRHTLLAHVARRVDLVLISDFARHLLALPMWFFESRRAGEILSRVNDTSKIRDAISGVATTAVVDGIIVMGLVGVLWMYDVALASVATLFLPILLGIVLFHQPTAMRRSHRTMACAADMYSHLVENVSAMETIKQFRAEGRREAETEDLLVDLVQSAHALERLSISSDGLVTLGTWVSGIVVLWIGGTRVIDGALTIGELMFFYSMLGMLLSPFERLASIGMQLNEALAAADRLYQILDLEREEDPGRNKVRLPSISNGISLLGVSFRYGQRAEVLSDLDLNIETGGVVALVGESGCGKSTLLKLLMGLHVPSSGRLLFDGIDVRDLRLESIRERIAIVSQEPYIFNATLRENIAIGRPDAPLADVVRAARVAQLDEFISELPERYETRIGERGVNLSGGQRQRLAIARALICDPDVLVFDEATSHLDTMTERAIQESLRTVFACKTVIIVAHRLTTVRDADRICVMANGRIVEQGTHDELMLQRGRYAELAAAQQVEAPIEGRSTPALTREGRLVALHAMGPARSSHPIARSVVQDRFEN